MKLVVKKNIIKILIFISVYILFMGVTIIKPYINGLFIDAITIKINFGQAQKTAITFAVILLLSVILTYILNIVVISLNTELVYAFKQMMIKHYYNIPILEALKYEPAYLNARISQDIESIIRFAFENLISIVSKAIIIVISLWFIYRISPTIAICSIVFIPFYIVSYIFMKKRYYVKNKNFKESSNQFYKIILGQFQFILEHKILSNEEKINEYLNKKYNKYKSCVIEFHSFSELFKAIDQGLSVMIQIGIMLIGAVEIIQSKMTIGDFMMVNSYYGYLIEGIRFYSVLGKKYQEFKVSLERMRELLSIQTEKNGTIQIKEVSSIKLNEISFHYGTNEPLINSLTYTFQKGKIYGMKGDNGAGKSTLSHLLIGLFENEEGYIYYDNEKLSDIDKKMLRKNICAYMQQGTKIPDMTIMEYYRYYCDDFQYDKMKRIIEQYMLMELYYSEDFRIDEFLCKKCNELSGGEWQKILLLSVMMMEKKVMILDEPTSAWDEKSKKIFGDLILKLCEERILIIITHDEDLLLKCSAICTIN